MPIRLDGRGMEQILLIIKLRDRNEFLKTNSHKHLNKVRFGTQNLFLMIIRINFKMMATGLFFMH